jgi:phosphoesterase RecJ-like protein
MISSEAHKTFQRLCRDAERFTLVTHIQPDGDALGSQVGLARFLHGQGKSVRIVNQDPAPELLRFIEDPAHPAEIYAPERHDALLRDSPWVVLLDNSAPDRLGSMEPIMRAVAARVLCIDHHPSRGTPWAVQILDERSCATAVMVYELACAAGWVPDGLAAEAIYVGLSTDTGFFRFNSTSARAHEVAADLLRRGVDPARVYQAIYERNSLAYTRLLGHALTDVRLVGGGAIATVTITRELIERLDADAVDVSEITTALLAMDGITVALLFRELADGRVKVSLRSKGAFDVHRLAAEFGGGGHRNASGIVMEGELGAVVCSVTERTAGRLG